MTETNNFSFDDGFREYTINNDPNRTLRVNTRDYNILQRVSKALNELDSKIDSLKEEDFKLADDASEIEAFDFASDGSEVLNVKEMGLRDLAYEVAGEKKGFYVLLNVNATPAAVKEFERLANIKEAVIRHITVAE